jgi:hypothetical protein
MIFISIGDTTPPILGLSESGCAELLLGHRKQSTTARYTHRSLSALRPFADEWAGLVLGESGAKVSRLGA